MDREAGIRRLPLCAKPLWAWLRGQQRRDQRIVQALLGAMASKGIGVGVGVLAVPLTIGYLGVEPYGMWLTITTLLTWLSLVDLGLANGLTNDLVDAYSSGQRQATMHAVATTFWLLVAISAVAGVIGFGLWYWIDWAAVFMVSPQVMEQEVAPALALAGAIALINIPLGVVQRVWRAQQESIIADGWLAATHLVSFGGLVLVTRLHVGLPALVSAVWGSALLVTLLSGAWLVGWHKPWLRLHVNAVHWPSLRRITTTGAMFWLIHVAWLLLFQTDNLIIAHYLGPQQVATYSVAWRLFGYTNLPHLLVYPALWAAYGEAFARADSRWIKRTFRWHLLAAVVPTLLAVVLLIVVGPQLIARWAGPQVVPPHSLLVGLGLWNILLAVSTTACCVLDSAKRIRWQALYGLATACVNLGLSLAFVTRWGITGVSAATVIAALVCGVVPPLAETAWVLRRLPTATLANTASR